MGITCELLWCFCHLFGLSFWRHPFTAEDPLIMHNFANCVLTKRKLTYIHILLDSTAFNVNRQYSLFLDVLRDVFKNKHHLNGFYKLYIHMRMAKKKLVIDFFSFVSTAHSVLDHTGTVQQSPGSKTKDASRSQINTHICIDSLLFNCSVVQYLKCC